jgi:membrane associated rhomboid family serine protease
MDWSLVLVSQGIETAIDHSEDAGWSLIVAEQDYERALEVIRQYRAENLRWPWRRRISRHEILFDWGSLAWVFLICVYFWISENRAGLKSAGLMDGVAVSHGEWWRLCTAILLHADAGHLAANASIGLVLLGLAMGRYGTGIGLLTSYLAGVGGNVATWLIYTEGHHSLGASGMVMGSLGLLAAQSVSTSPKSLQAVKYVISGTLAGVMLFVLLGLSPGTDVLAHFGGFVTGLLLGSLLRLAPRLAQNTAVNLFAGLLFALLVIVTWRLALERGG